MTLPSWRPPDALAAAFDDIDTLAQSCRLRDCAHEEEIGCADRLRNYHKLLREVRRSEQTPLERSAERARWKVLIKAVGPRSRHQRG